MDAQAWLERDDGEEAQKAYQYYMRPDPEQREFLGPAQEEEDPVSGKIARFRLAKVGMVRGAAAENMKEVKVYLGFDGKPMIPHIRLDNPKALQGWYQSKFNDKQNGRPRPCFTDAVLTEPYGGYCVVGCRFCLAPGSMVDTPNGPRAVETIQEGDLVYARTQEGRVVVPVLATMKLERTVPLVQVTLTDGRTLRVTLDHPIYAKGRGWVEAGDLRKGDTLEDISETEVLQGLRHTYSTAAESLRRLFGRHEKARVEQRQKAFGRNSKEDVFLSRKQSGQYGRAGQVAPDAGVEGWASRGSAFRQIWLSIVETLEVHLSQGPNAQFAVHVGVMDGPVARPQELRLGFRAVGDSITGRDGLRAGLQVGERYHPGGQGLPDARGGIQDPTGAQDGLHHSPARRAQVEEVRYIDGSNEVYDIQTPVGNFYAENQLVSNCYINSGFRGYRGSGLVSVPLNYGEFVRKSLSKMRTATAGYFSSFTDPFLPLEDIYHNTQQGAEAFDAAGLPVFFLSRLHYPGWAFDLLKRNKYSYAQKSLNTGDDEDWKKLSPGAISLEEHIQEVGELRRQGIYTSIQVNPICPGITNHDDIRRLFERLAAVGNNHVIVKFVEANHPWAGAMVERMEKAFGGNRAAHFKELFIENQAGAQKTVTWEYRKEAHDLYQKWATELGMTYSTCYEYRKDEERGWISIGPEYITSDQCHGKRVPMFTRRDLDQPFQEVGVCPPSGCLTCADNNAGKPRCGNDLFGQAKALRMPDFKEAVL